MPADCAFVSNYIDPDCENYRSMLTFFLKKYRFRLMCTQIHSRLA